jgi:hypothetical protein
MKYAARLAMVLIAGLWVLTAPQTSAAQGGHGGGGGHGFGGHGGGHSSHGSFSGNASGHARVSGAGHSISHSVAHFFGWRGKNAGSQPPAASAPLVDRKMIPQSNSSIVFPLHHSPGGAFFFEQPSPVSRHRRFGFGGCPAFGFPTNSFFFGNGFDCFNSGYYFSDAFFFGFSSSSLHGWPAWSGNAPTGSMDAPLPASPVQSDSSNTNSPSVGTGNEAEDNAKRQPPVTLLQLRDGSMYGLTEYWVDSHKLHYFTTYGGEGSVPIQGIGKCALSSALFRRVEVPLALK